MSKEVKETERQFTHPPYSPIVERDGTYYVLVSHEELDHLVGRLLQMCDLTGDTEQRQAMKSEIKQRSRSWLDNIYECSGYERFSGIKNDVEPIVIK